MSLLWTVVNEKYKELFGRVLLFLVDFIKHTRIWRQFWRSWMDMGQRSFLLDHVSARKIITGERTCRLLPITTYPIGYRWSNAASILGSICTLDWGQRHHFLARCHCCTTKELLENKIHGSKQLELIREGHQEITTLLGQMSEFQHSLEEHPTAIFWIEFLEISDILYIIYIDQCEGG